MKLIYAKSKWEMWDSDTELFLQRTKKDGYDATEFYLNESLESPEKLIDLHGSR